MLEDVTAKCHALCARCHCPIAHIQDFFIGVGLRSPSDYYRDRTAPDNSLKRVRVACVYCFYNICAGLRTHPRSMSYYIGVMRVLDVLSAWVHHRHERYTPLVALIRYHSEFLEHFWLFL